MRTVAFKNEADLFLQKPKLFLKSNIKLIED